MAKFCPGDNVMNLLTCQKGIVSEVCPAARGRQLYRVRFDDNKIETCLEQNLDLLFDTSNPFELCRKGIFGNRDQFVLLNTTFKINNSNNNTISSLKASKTIFKAYQFKPLLKFLNSLSRRVLIADEVGLGKTIEAGHILLELRAREELRSALIVCPNSLKIKWQTELKEKFGLNFKIYESLNDAVEDLKAHPSNARGILNYDKIRAKRTSQKKDDYPTNRLIEFLREGQRKYSIILCDEAHRMRNNETQTYRGMYGILEHADSVVFLTATPIMLGENDLYNLLHLLEPYNYDNREVFRNHINSNRPFVEAISMINARVPLADIEEHLTNKIIKRELRVGEDICVVSESKVYDEYEDIPLYQHILELLKEEDTLALRARLQREIASLSSINKVFSRTRKREISTEERQQTERKAHKVPIALTDEEKWVYDSVIDNYIESQGGYDTSYDGEESLPPGTILGLIQKKRMVASSVNGYRLFSQSEYDVEKYCRLVEESKGIPDAKIEKLKELFQGIRGENGKKVIVFSIFKFTVRYLEIKLRELGVRTFAIHGDVHNREAVITEFKNCGEFCVLLSTEVGSEGLDLQFCSYLVNYDLPWNPMVVEQRIGRIDRFGQPAPSIHIYNLVVKGSIQELIYDRLLVRIGIFKGVIGDLETILEENVGLINSLEREFYCTDLTDEEREKKVRDMALAYENQRLHLEEIEKGLTDTLTNDIYFQDEINKIKHRKLYVTEEELANYLKMLFDSHLSTCRLEAGQNSNYRILPPKSKPKVLTNFLSEYQPSGEDYEDLFSAYKKRLLYDLEEEGCRYLTFNQEYAFENKEVDYVNLYNPLIIAASRFFGSRKEEIGRTFQMKIKRHDDFPLSAGEYYLGVYVVSANSDIMGKMIKSDILVPVVYDVAKDKTETDEEVNLEIFGMLQDKSEYLPVEEDTEALPEGIFGNIESDFTEYISNYVGNRMKDNKLREESLKQLEIKQINEYFSPRVETIEREIRQRELQLELAGNSESETNRISNSLRLAHYRLKMLEDAKLNSIERIQSKKLPVLTYSLISISKIIVS